MTKTDAANLAKKIFDEFDKQIVEAVKGTSIPPSFIAGLVANEAGKDRQGNIRRGATRFEPGVYSHLKRVAESPRASYQGIKHAQLADATEASLRALSTSVEATQMMGYWCIVLGCTLADLKNPDKHFFYTVKLLHLNGFPARPTEPKMDGEMRQWNTGRETGQTYHENYVANAQAIRAAYRELEKTRVHRTVDERAFVPEIAEPVVVQTSNPPPAPTADSVVIEKEATAGFFSQIKTKLAAWIASLGGLTTLEQYKQSFDDLGMPGWVIVYVLAAAGVIFLGWLAYEAIDHIRGKDRQRLLTATLINANSTASNMVVTACQEDLDKFAAAGWTVVPRQ